MEVDIKEIIQSYNDYLKKFPHGCELIATYLREDGTIQLGLKSILDFSEGVTWLLEVNQLLDKYGLKNEVSMDKIKEYLEEINTSLEIGDYFTVADLFDYEIKTFFENCKPYENENGI